MLVEEIKKINNLQDLLNVANYILQIDILSASLGAAKNNSLILLKNFLYNLIVEQKQSIKPENSTKINIKRVLNRYYCSKTKLWKIYNEAPYINRDIGSVPKIFLSTVSDKANVAKELYKLFAKYSFILNYDYTHDIDLIKINIEKYTNSLEQELSKLINKNVEISFVGHGFFGNGFKLRIFNEAETKDFFYKVFYPYDMRHKHGADVEVAYAFFASKNAPKKQFVKFFMGRLGSPYEKDAFLLTEFVYANPNYTKQNTILSLNYIHSHDKRIENSINGKIVDFGALREKVPELNDKKLRKLVRIITMRIKKHVNKSNICYTWQMCNKNCISLKKFIQKIDENDYIKAIDLIKENIPVLPEELVEDLLNIKNWDNKHEINYIKLLQAKDILTSDIFALKQTIKTLNLDIKTWLDGDETIFGYAIIDLFEDRQAVYILDKDNNITSIRIERKVDNQFITLLEFDIEDINKYVNIDITSILNCASSAIL